MKKEYEYTETEEKTQPHQLMAILEKTLLSLEFKGDIGLAISKHKNLEIYSLSFTKILQGKPGRIITNGDKTEWKKNFPFLRFNFTDSKSIDTVIRALKKLKKKMIKFLRKGKFKD